MTKINPIDILFNPGSVAIVGASRNPSVFSYNMLRNLVKLKFQGKVYPVNPNVQELEGVKVYPNLKSIEDGVDLVISAVPAAATLNVIKDCVEKKVKMVVMLSAGFSEIGQEGRKVQDEIAFLLKQAGIRAIGPNCLGPINTLNSFVISFGPVEKVHKGGISIVTQSGFYDPRLEWIFWDLNLGINKIINLGNKIDVNEVDLLEYLAQDPTTRVIAMHMESIAGDSKKLFKLLKQASKEKPVIILKSGRTEAGVAAATSHTASIIKGSPIVLDTAFAQAGVIRAYDVQEFFDFMKVFEFHNHLKLTGNRVAIGPLSGGEGVIMSDLCYERGFLVAQVNPETNARLQKVSPPWSIPPNPFDIGVSTQFHSPEAYRNFFDAMTDDPNVDCIVAQLRSFSSTPLPEDVRKHFVEPFIRARNRKPVAIWLLDQHQQDIAVIQALEANYVPVYSTCSRAANAISALHRYAMMHRE